ncbi:hypothetical protein [Nostoc sp. C110]|uniref:hypothetical protein n=1 Tax=Nostoc sp. C110 TaxID=3349876 RepID=UPI00370DB1C3
MIVKKNALIRMSVHGTIEALLYLAKSCDRSRSCDNRNCAVGVYCCPRIAILSETTRSLLSVFEQNQTNIEYVPVWLSI